MTIYSWNMLFRNRERDRVLDFVSKSDFDIFCLQEVPGSFLPRLKELPYHIAYAVDMERLFPYKPIMTYNVILSRYEIAGQHAIPFPDYQDILPLRTRIAVQLLRMVHFSKIRNRNGIVADLRTPSGLLRVINLHLILAHPDWRLQEFECAMVERDVTKPTIVCGDFNILERPHIAPLNWILGGRVTDALRYTRERTTIEKRFVAHELVNALRGQRTHSVSRSQLDHILVSSHFAIKDARVLPERYGSDHHPISVEVTIH